MTGYSGSQAHAGRPAIVTARLGFRIGKPLGLWRAADA